MIENYPSLNMKATVSCDVTWINPEGNHAMGNQPVTKRQILHYYSSYMGYLKYLIHLAPHDYSHDVKMFLSITTKWPRKNWIHF